MWPHSRPTSKPLDIPRSELVKLYRQAIQAGVPLEALEKKLSTLVARSQVTESIEDTDDELKKKLPTLVRYGALGLPVIMVFVGIILIGSATFPLIHYFFSTLPVLQAANVLAPVPHDKVLDVNPIVIAQAHAKEGEEVPDPPSISTRPIILDAELDYTNLTNWFMGEQGLGAGTSFQQTEEETYTIEIPKLKITNATVTMGGTDLSHSLIQYPGTAAPGEFGAPVIFGHSVLRQFYNPSEKNPRRYTSIFSTIMTLKKGDEIWVTKNGQKYTYVVQDKIEVKPEDTFILTQKFDSKALKLVTCTPEGTYLRRGVIIAQLVGGGQ